MILKQQCVGLILLMLNLSIASGATDNTNILGEWINAQGDVYQIRALGPGESKSTQNPNDFMWISVAGAGGKTYDPETGIKIESVDQGNGTAIVTTIYPDGRQTIRTRPAGARRLVNKNEWQLSQKKQELAKFQKEYPGEHYPDAAIQEKVNNLNKEIAQLSALPPLKPVEKEDPINFETARQNPKSIPVVIHLEQKDPPYHYDFVQAQLADGTVYARRTLVDIRDVSGLPAPVANDLIREWSPPEWLKLSYQINPTTKTPELRAEVWRLHVNYSPENNNQIDKIHTPFATAFVLKPKKVKALPKQVALPPAPKTQTTIVDNIEVSPDNQVKLRYKTDLQTPPTELPLGWDGM